MRRGPVWCGVVWCGVVWCDGEGCDGEGWTGRARDNKDWSYCVSMATHVPYISMHVLAKGDLIGHFENDQ